MKRPRFTIAHVNAIRSFVKAVTEAKYRKGTHIHGALSGVSEIPTGQMESYTSEDVVITDSKILMSLSHRATQICIQIMAELKFNNALWHFDHTKNTRDAAAIKELRERSILLHTEDTRIHYVNPDIIRKGNKMLVAANTAVVTMSGKVEIAMIRPLLKKNIKLSAEYIEQFNT